MSSPDIHLREVTMALRFPLVVFLLSAASALAEPPGLAFRPAGAGLYDFDTGLFRGRLKVDGKYQGIYPVVDADSKIELVHPPGIFSFYRVFERSKRHGECARDWPTQPKLLPDGAVEVRWPPAADHPVEIVGVYRWKTPDTLDLEIAVTPQRDMPRFELFLSSYLTKTFLASVYLKPDGQGLPRFVPVNPKPQSTGGYVMFPRDDGAVRMIQDGRWKLGSNPVDWAIERWLAAPIILRRDASHGLTAVMMSPPGDCFAISSPWNPATIDGGGYRSIYLSLFGRDLKGGQTAHARCRLLIAHELTDQQAVERYEEYVRQSRR
jgi:hypothetical protein